MSAEKINAVCGKQLSVFLENRPGALADVTSLLGGKDINIYALTLTGGIDHGYLRMVVDRHEEAAKLLRGLGQLILERDVVLLEIPNAPGALGEVTRVWAKAGINIEYAYCAGGPSVEKGLVVIRVDDARRAVDLLE